MNKRFFKIIGRPVLIAVACVAIVGAGYASYCGILIFSGNFHVVEEGQLYRSAELSKNQFAKEIDDHHIKSILNLRGPNPGSPWYDNELAVAREHGVTHYDVGLSARRIVTPEKIDKILAILRDSQKPLLIHCNSGSDRTGLVSALYLYEIRGQSPVEASRALSLRYGHFPYLTSQTGEMDKSFDTYVQASTR